MESPQGNVTDFKRYNIAPILDLSWRIGARQEVSRVAENIRFVKALQELYGLQEHPRQQEASRWVTFDLLHSLSRVEEEIDWY